MTETFRPFVPKLLDREGCALEKPGRSAAEETGEWIKERWGGILTGWLETQPVRVIIAPRQASRSAGSRVHGPGLCEHWRM